MARGIYQIKNTVTGNCYIGQARDIAKRWKGHRQQLAHGNHHSSRLQDDWDEYGQESFVWEVLEEVSPTADLTGAEARHINVCNPAYNTAPVIERPLPSFMLAPRVNTRASEDCHAVATIRDRTRCIGCGLAINIETQIHPGVGQIVEIREINPETSAWEDISTAHFREDSVAELWAEVATLEKRITYQERFKQTLEERIANLEAEVRRLRIQLGDQSELLEEV